MGRTVEVNPIRIDTESNRFEIYKAGLRGTIETIFRDGAAVSHDGTKVYFGVSPWKLPDRIREEFEDGRITTVLPQEVGINESPNNSRTSRLHLVPPESYRFLSYKVGRKGATAVYMLYGLDEQNNPVEETLEGFSGIIRGLQQLALIKLNKFGLDAKKYRPTQALGEIFREIADAQFEGGLGEYNQAVARLKVQKRTAEAADSFLQNGKH